ncbi:MAG: glycoside hydrolase family 3 N-terminal domain-containing protein [Acidimicrobiales bacterium]
MTPRRRRGARAVAAGLLLLTTGCAASGATRTDAPGHATTSALGYPRPTTTTTSAPPPLCRPNQVITTWSLRRRAAQLVVAPVEESDVAAVAPLVSDGVGGVILFGTSAPSDLAAQLAALRSQAEGGVAPLVMTDEEGGGVQRMANLVGDLPWARTMAATDSPAEVQALAQHTAVAMRSLGVTMDLAPVLDVDGGPGPNARHPDGARSFSADPQTAATYGVAFARGLLAGGVIPVVKHFPGLGTASYNTDFGPASTAPLSSLKGRDLVPFQQAINAGLPSVMVSNATVPGLTTGPASLSRAAVEGLLRHQLGFSGLVITDSLSAGAISATGLSPAQASVRAVGAGVDLVLYDAVSPQAALQTSDSIVTALVAAVQTHALGQQVLDGAVLQVLKAKGVTLCP